MKELDPVTVWNSCLEIIKDNISEVNYRTWFAPVKAVSLKDKALTIEVPSDYVRNHIEDNYIDLIRLVLHRVLGEGARLIYNVRIVGDSVLAAPEQDRKVIENNEISLAGDSLKYNGNPYLIPGLKKVRIDSHLNPVYTFENFIEGECNRFGRSAGLSIADKPGKTAFNPLFVYGGPGLGKTHLAQAIGIAIKEKYPDKIVLYVSANRFQTQFMNAVGLNNNLVDFLRYYQSVDVLIIDDVHEFAEKKGTQNAFFQIFNYLHQSGKQLVLTSDRAPVELQGLEQRLLSRFKWGLSVELLPPSYETRLAILKHKSFREGAVVPDEVLEFIARKVKSNIRELEGTLLTLIAQSTFAKRNMTLELAQELIDKIVTDSQSEISISRIQDAVCEYFNLPHDAILAKTRKREIVQARQIAMYLSRSLTKVSLASIGAQIGGKDHATVLHACNTVCDLIDTDRTFRQYVTDIEKMLVTN